MLSQCNCFWWLHFVCHSMAIPWCINWFIVPLGLWCCLRSHFKYWRVLKITASWWWRKKSWHCTNHPVTSAGAQCFLYLYIQNVKWKFVKPSREWKLPRREIEINQIRLLVFLSSFRSHKRLEPCPDWSSFPFCFWHIEVHPFPPFPE